jgi:hypothetical protein
MTATQFRRLFSAFKLNSITLRNRIVSTPLGAAFVANGVPTEEYLRYLVAKAKGGCGLIGCFGGASIHPTGRVGSWPEVHYWDDEVIPHLQRPSEAVHEYGAALVAQLCHRGHVPRFIPPVRCGDPRRRPANPIARLRTGWIMARSLPGGGLCDGRCSCAPGPLRRRRHLRLGRPRPRAVPVAAEQPA